VPAPAATVTALPGVNRVERVDVLGGLIHEYVRPEQREELDIGRAS
jgi:hypothetical protein